MTESKTPIPTVEPEREPEYVGAYSEPCDDQCADMNGNFVEDLIRCANDATHTVVMKEPNGGLAEIPMCEDCGEPQDA